MSGIAWVRRKKNHNFQQNKANWHKTMLHLKNLLFYWLFLKQKHLISNKMSKIADFTCKIIRAFLFLKYRSSFYVHFYVTRKWKNKSLTIKLVTQVSNPSRRPIATFNATFSSDLKVTIPQSLSEWITSITPSPGSKLSSQKMRVTAFAIK